MLHSVRDLIPLRFQNHLCRYHRPHPGDTRDEESRCTREAPRTVMVLIGHHVGILSTRHSPSLPNSIPTTVLLFWFSFCDSIQPFYVHQQRYGSALSMQSVPSLKRSLSLLTLPANAMIQWTPIMHTCQITSNPPPLWEARQWATACAEVVLKPKCFSEVQHGVADPAMGLAASVFSSYL